MGEHGRAPVTHDTGARRSPLVAAAKPRCERITLRCAVEMTIERVALVGMVLFAATPSRSPRWIRSAAVDALELVPARGGGFSSRRRVLPPQGWDARARLESRV